MRQTIRALRDARGWTQLQLANRLAVTPATVSNWERGVFEPKASQLRALAAAFDVSMDAIAFGAGDTEASPPPGGSGDEEAPRPDRQDERR